MYQQREIKCQSGALSKDWESNNASLETKLLLRANELKRAGLIAGSIVALKGKNDVARCCDTLGRTT